MDILSLFILLFIPFGLSHFTVAFMVQDEDGMLSILESANYHLGELQSNINQLSSIQRSTRTRRDDRGAEAIRKTDFLLNALVDFCFQIQNFDQMTQNSTSDDHNSTIKPATANAYTTNVTVITTTDIPTYMNTTNSTSESTSGPSASLKMNEMEDPWVFPKVRPLMLDSVKVGGEVHLLFHVLHSTPVKITHLDAFDRHEILLSEVQESKMMQSLVNRKVLTSGYCEKGYEIDNMFAFESISKPDHGVNVVVDVCGGVHRTQKNQSPKSRRTRQAGPVDVVSENIVLPRFQLDSNIGEGIVAAFPGMNATIDIYMDPNTMSFMTVSGIFHDRKARKMIKDEYRLDFNSGHVDVKRQVDGQNPQLFSVDLLPGTNSSVNSTSGPEVEFESGNMTKQSVRITVFTESGQLTGKLYLEATKQREDEDPREFVKSVTVYHVVEVKKPGSRRVFPRRRVYVETEPIVTCNDEGNRNQPKIGRHCTLLCSATGRGISDVSISRDNSTDTIIQSLSYQLVDRTSTVVDLGRYSSDVKGMYVCSVTDGKGKQHSHHILVNVGAPKIDVNNTSILYLENGTSLIICAVDGVPPINMRVEIEYSSAPRKRVDNVARFVRTLVDDEDDALLTLALPTAQVSYPATSVICIATSVLGYDNYSISLSDVTIIPPLPTTTTLSSTTSTTKTSTTTTTPPTTTTTSTTRTTTTPPTKTTTTLTTTTTSIREEMKKPQIVLNASKIVNFPNGTTSVTCTAIRASRLEAVVSSADKTSSFNLDDLPGQQERVEESIDGGQSVTWYLDNQDLIEASLWLYCVAMNSDGVDFFKLPPQTTTVPDTTVP